MSSIIENTNRIGNLTSSKIGVLMGKGKGENGFSATALTYIKEVNLERKLGRSIKTDAYSKEMAWGTFLQDYVFHNHLEFGWLLCPDVTDVHPTIDYWAGSKDLFMPDVKIGEIKCYQPKNFAEYADALMTGDTDIIKESHPNEYWQGVSNAIINGVSKAELVLFMPYKKELNAIRELAEAYDGADQWKYRFISESEDYSLAHLPNNGYYKNLVRFEFEVPQEDIDTLTEKVQLAGSMLIERKVYEQEEIIEPSVVYPSGSYLQTTSDNYFSPSAKFDSDINLGMSEYELVEYEQTFGNMTLEKFDIKSVNSVRLMLKRTRIDIMNEAEAQKKANPSEKKAINSEKKRIVGRLKTLENYLKNLK